MKNLKKNFIVMLVTIMATTMLISCGSPKTSPEESAKIFLDVVLKDDKTNMEKIGMSEEDYTTSKKAQEDELMEGLGASGIDSSILTDETITNLKANVFKGMAKLEYEVTPVSTDKDTAVVSIKINSFSLSEITTNGQAKIIKIVTENPSMTEEQIYQEVFKIIGEIFAEGPVKEDTTTVTVNLTKINNIWIPDANFEKDIAKVIISMN